VVVAYVPNWERLRAFTPPTGGETFDEWIAPQRTAAIGRIVEAVGKTPNSEIDLATDIFEAFVETRTKIDPDESSKASNRLTKVKRVQKGLQKQITLLSTDRNLSQRINDAYGVAPRPIIQLLFELQSLEKELSSLAKQWRSKTHLPPSLKGRRPSEIEWLAGASLPLVYQRNFLLPAGRSRGRKDKPGGPTVRFIAATLKEIDVSYSEESIVRAMSRLATLRSGL
jgi:hypothetical protein